MITTAFVKIWNKRVGAVAWNPESGLADFEFTPGFLQENWDLSPLKMPTTSSTGKIYSFPELRSSSTFRGLPGLIADVLPDKYAHALINAWLTQQGREPDSMNPVEMLCFIGKRGMGALEFEPALSYTGNTTSKIEIDSLVNTAQKILDGRKRFSTRLSKEDERALNEIVTIGTSAGGARAKAVIAYNPKTGEVRSGQTDAPKGFRHWLIKLDGVKDNQLGTSHGYGRVEMAYHLMAVDCGIEMTECRLLEENERAHFMTLRFDRQQDNQKLHQQSFCALMHYDYNDIMSYSYEQLFQTMRMLHLPYPQMEQMFRRMVFNVMSRNCDDHTKNFSFLMDKTGDWKLSPAYDLCHAYRPGSIWVSRQSLSVQGKRENINQDDLLSVAKQVRVKKAGQIVKQISSVIKNWDQYAAETGVEKALRAAIKKTLIPL